ncbi:MAG: SDR family NAD(P)-dependent oxidoreductase [Rhodocyclaceae bacterium]|jgi:NAD(P)-dependent dehydrogenase (short-subunit alcohol dehydrogenase family)|nr:SDR family NAD(P)-dependent oxidoreductase [Rhodocyclaceae bacterium]
MAVVVGEGGQQGISFKDQVVVVTGAGNGLGRAYALDLARRGAAVVVNDLGTGPDGVGASASAADLVVAEIRQAGGLAVANHESVATPEGGQSIVEAALQHFGRLDAVVNNAGILRTGPFEAVSAESLDRLVAANLKGAFHVSQPALRIMKEQGYGRIVMITSATALFGEPTMAAYAATKGGLFGVMNCLALAGAPHGVLCNAVAPLAVSRMAASVAEEDVKAMMGIYEMIGLQPMMPEYVVPLVTYLASRQCAVNQATYGAVGGCFSRIYVAQTQGWLGPRERPATAEEIMEHLAEIEAREGSQETRSVAEDLLRVAQRVGVA